MTPVPVLLLVRELGIGGTERQLVETARFLDYNRFTPHVGCFRPTGPRLAELKAAGVPILHLPMHSFLSPKLLSASSVFLNYVRRNGIKVVHSFDAPLNIFAVPLAKFAGIPAVLSSQRGERQLTGRTTHHCLRVTDRLTDAVVVNCQAMRSYLIEDEGVAASKIRVCHNAVDVEAYARRAVDSPWPGKTVVGVICALRREKSLDTLLRAFAALDRSNSMLVIVGSGPEETKLKALAGELRLAATCHFEPATSQVAEWLSRIDIFVLPSRTEALSNSLMEAMACECCVVASRVGGNPELVDEQVSGMLFEAGNVNELSGKLADLVGNSDRRKQLAVAGSAKMAAQFTYARAAATMQQIYDSVLAR
jgi:glycosyltransferase involved in cell wall biosynthesis